MKHFYSFRLIRLLPFVVIFLSLSAAAQVQTVKFNHIISKVNGYWEYLPQGYNPAAATTYPVIISFPGLGSMGYDTSKKEMDKALKGQPARWINFGLFPTSFSVGGKTFKFIVITPSFQHGPDIFPLDVDSVINYVVRNYKVDVNRIYLTGFSYGGGVVWRYVTHSKEFANKIAAIVPIAATTNLDHGDCRMVASTNLPIWAFHNDRDDKVPVAYAVNAYNYLNELPSPIPPAKLTVMHKKGHIGWYEIYDPRPKTSYKEDGMDVYEWMLQYQRGSAIPSPYPISDIPPVAHAGKDKYVALPTDTVMLSGWASDADGKIVKLSWRKLSGPSLDSTTNLDNYKVKLFGLVKGLYIYELTATDNGGGKGRDTVRVIVDDPNIMLKIFPNPSSTTFKIVVSSNMDDLMQVRVVDVQGRVVESMNRVSKKNTLMLGQNYISGVYFIEVIQRGQKVVATCIKQNR